MKFASAIRSICVGRHVTLILIEKYALYIALLSHGDYTGVLDDATTNAHPLHSTILPDMSTLN